MNLESMLKSLTRFKKVMPLISLVLSAVLGIIFYYVNGNWVIPFIFGNFGFSLLLNFVYVIFKKIISKKIGQKISEIVSEDNENENK